MFTAATEWVCPEKFPLSWPKGKYPDQPSTATAIPTIPPSLINAPDPVFLRFGSLVSKSIAMYL